MPFEADIIVVAQDVPDVRLVAEVRTSSDRFDAIEPSLRRYMLDRRCSLALLVSPESTWIYRDTFADFRDESVERVGKFPTAQLLDIDPVPTGATELEHAVHAWLERLATAWPAALPRDDAARLPVVDYLVPGVVDGRVLAGVRP